MSKRIAVLLIVATALGTFPALASSSVRLNETCTLNPAYKHLLEFLHSPIATPQESTTTAFGGAKGTSCNDGAVSVEVFPKVTLATARTMHPHEAKAVKSKCTQAFKYSGSNTTAVTNAKTGKTKMTTVETADFFCYEKGASGGVVEVIATPPTASEFPQAESLEEAIAEAIINSLTK